MPLRRAAGLAVALAASLSLLDLSEAIADDGKDVHPATPRPWEKGSTQDQRDRAHGIFSEGNDHFFKRDYARAIELYEQAIVVFDHPRIRLALARTLIRVGRPADAHPHLVSALRWGAAPLDAEEYAEALDQQAALSRQLGVLVIRCRARGARLTLDGRDIAPCPGEQRHVVMPGRHQVVGKQVGYLPFTEDAVADAGRETPFDVELKTLEAAAVKQRRWATWKPWAVVGGGAVLALAGLPFRRLATTNINRYKERVAALCAPDRCDPNKPEDADNLAQALALAPIESRAKLENGIAISLWVLGGAVVTTGLVTVFLNREHLLIPKTESLVVTSLISQDVVGIGVIGGF